MKDKFKVYTNPNIKKREKEVTYELEIPDEDTLAVLFMTSPYFMEFIVRQDLFYYPVDPESDESLMAPFFNKEAFRDFVRDSEMFRIREGVPLAALLHIEAEGDDGEEMESIFHGCIQYELTKFLHTTVMIMNLGVAMEDGFGDVVENLFEELADNGYLDQLLNNICERMSDPETLEELLFPEEE